MTCVKIHCLQMDLLMFEYVSYVQFFVEKQAPACIKLLLCALLNLLLRTNSVSKIKGHFPLLSYY